MGRAPGRASASGGSAAVGEVGWGVKEWEGPGRARVLQGESVRRGGRAFLQVSLCRREREGAAERGEREKDGVTKYC